MKYDDMKEKLDLKETIIRNEGIGYGFGFGILLGWVLGMGGVTMVYYMVTMV